MRIRKTFAVVFLCLLLLSAYLGFAPLSIPNDKFVHFLIFFCLTTTFYWVVDTTRRRLINSTLLVCTLLGGVGSELVQSFVPYRVFDLYDIVANVLGSLLALAISSWYHKGMLERKRAAKYSAIPADGAQLETGSESVPMSDLGTVEELPERAS
ncbi:hypothetical protein V1512DRAFT_264106 [Lipomyces arxii]|uniref:uncharacterized protein n=1 Tax=Lipomyces arxii TaxID=56418 RepID=UPI0034CF0B40